MYCKFRTIICININIPVSIHNPLDLITLPPIMFINVDFPAPLGPSKPKKPTKLTSVYILKSIILIRRIYISFI